LQFNFQEQNDWLACTVDRGFPSGVIFGFFTFYFLQILYCVKKIILFLLVVFPVQMLILSALERKQSSGQEPQPQSWVGASRDTIA
jgi:hypothetical protein